MVNDIVHEGKTDINTREGQQDGLLYEVSVQDTWQISKHAAWGGKTWGLFGSEGYLSHQKISVLKRSLKVCEAQISP